MILPEKLSEQSCVSCLCQIRKKHLFSSAVVTTWMCPCVLKKNVFQRVRGELKQLEHLPAGSLLLLGCNRKEASAMKHDLWVLR